MKKLYYISIAVFVISLAIGFGISLKRHKEMTLGIQTRETAYTNSVAEIEKVVTTTPSDAEIKAKGLVKLAETKEATNSQAQRDWALETFLLLFAIPLSLGGVTFFMGRRMQNQVGATLA